MLINISSKMYIRKYQLTAVIADTVLTAVIADTEPIPHAVQIRCFSMKKLI